ncbi:MAG: Gfo/Idh/MocA family oxidoreductase [Lentisphaeria bacterium]|nr:Gfo/Idh/MocA family oxidoreductase [Lentisphaeria bacterium]
MAEKKLRVGVIGCGGRGWAHASAYKRSDKVVLAACADIYKPARDFFRTKFGFKKCYADYRDMLLREHLDVVSVCVWPHLHCQAVLDCASLHHPPRLINSEKPMAPTFGEAVRMHEACVHRDIMLTFCHQRRFGASWSTAKKLLDSGAIGTLQRMEMNTSNMFDWGTHWFDMMHFFNNDLQASWVMGQIGCAADNKIFGATMETAGIAYVKWPNDVTGLLTTGQGNATPYEIRLMGSAGMIDVYHGKCRLFAEGQKWTDVSLGEQRPDDTYLHILDSIECLLNKRQSILCSENALRATSLIFATYESSRRRERVFLPLAIDDSPLLSMLANGDIVIPDWPTYISAQDEDDGFRFFYNGKNLRGLTCAPQRSWHSRAGILGSDKADAWIYLDKDLGNFELRFDFRLGSRSEAGVVFWADPRKGPKSGLDIVIADDHLAPPGLATTGAIRGLSPATRGAGTTSSWRPAKIVCQDGKVTLSIAGQDLSTHDLAAPALADHAHHGALGLVARRGEVEFRSVFYAPRD